MKCDELKAIESEDAVIRKVQLVYLKSEVDAAIEELKAAHHKERHEYINMIAELKEKHKTEVKELLYLIRDKSNNFNSAFDSVEKELRHQKYKRCLAMANLCHWKSAVFIYKKDKNDFYWRWYKRWLKIAEQFKEEAK